jgi:hypothetical protein
MSMSAVALDHSRNRTSEGYADPGRFSQADLEAIVAYVKSHHPHVWEKHRQLAPLPGFHTDYDDYREHINQLRTVVNEMRDFLALEDDAPTWTFADVHPHLHSQACLELRRERKLPGWLDEWLRGLGQLAPE